jgi:hypothetical protein
MSMQIPDYAAFAQMPIGARRQSIEMIRRFAGNHAATLYLQVYQFDPDAGLREMARQELAKQGITPPTEPTPMTAKASPAAADFDVGDSSYSFTSAFVESAQPAAAFEELTGGDGRPVQRGPQLANVFTLHRRNPAYLTGQRQHIPHNLLGYVLTVGILILTFGILFVAFRAFPDMPNDSGFSLDAVLALVGAIFAAIIIGAISLYMWNTRRDRRYETHGQLLLGQVRQASGSWHSSSEGGRSYKVTVEYRVRLPDGTILDHRGSATRNDLGRGGALPHSGDPVAVLAIDRDNLRLL